MWVIEWPPWVGLNAGMSHAPWPQLFLFITTYKLQLTSELPACCLWQLNFSCFAKCTLWHLMIQSIKCISKNFYVKSTQNLCLPKECSETCWSFLLICHLSHLSSGSGWPHVYYLRHFDHTLTTLFIIMLHTASHILMYQAFGEVATCLFNFSLSSV